MNGARVDLDLKSLRCLVVLAEELNFSRAAERLRLTQPALSSQIRGLNSGWALRCFTARRGASGCQTKGPHPCPARGG